MATLLSITLELAKSRANASLVPMCSGKSSALDHNSCTGWQHFFADTEGDNWFDCDDSKTDPCSCDEYNLDLYVVCEGNTITDISLNSNRMSGSIGDGLSLLTQLTSLAVSNNDLRGTIPESLASLTALQKLYLFNNKLTGGIPSFLGSLTSLKGLALEANYLGGTIPASLSSLSALTALSMQCNGLHGRIPDFINYKTLKANCVVGGPLWLKKCTSYPANYFDCPLPPAVGNASASLYCAASCGTRPPSPAPPTEPPTPTPTPNPTPNTPSVPPTLPPSPGPTPNPKPNASSLGVELGVGGAAVVAGLLLLLGGHLKKKQHRRTEGTSRGAELVLGGDGNSSSKPWAPRFVN